MSNRRSERKRQRETTVPPSQSAERLDWKPLLSIVLVAAIVSLAGFDNGFTQDDASLIAASTRLHGFGEWKSILMEPYWMFPAQPDLYRPLTSLFLALQYVLGGGSPAMYHLVSFVLYAGAGVATYRLATRILPAPVSLAMALLFAAHPVHVEAIVLAVCQNEIAVGLLACLMVNRYLDRRRSGSITRNDWLVLAAAYLLGAFAKEQGLLLPAFLLLAEVCLIRGESVRARARVLWPGFAGFALIGIIAVALRMRVLDGQFGPTLVAEALRGQTMGGRALTMLHVVPEWTRLFLWPVHLRAEYSPREFVASTSLGAHEILGLLIIAAAIGLAWISRRRAPAVTFGVLWTAIALLPVSNVLIPTGVLIAERTLFVASIGFVIALGGVLDVAMTRWPEVARQRSVLVAAVLVVTLAAALRSVARVQVWHDFSSLTVASVADAPQSYRVRQVYGELLFEQNRVPEAVNAFTEATRLAPEPWRVRNRLAQHYRMLGADSVALSLLRKSLEERAEPETLAQIPPALIAIGRYDEASALADTVIRIANAPPVMVWLKHVADSARAANAPPGSVRIGLGQGR